MKQDVLDILNAHRVLTLATNRPDGWPQATMVGYANDDLVIYMLISRSSQKFANLREDNRVALTIGADADKLADIRGLAMSALAYPANTPDPQRQGYELSRRFRSLTGPKRRSSGRSRATWRSSIFRRGSVTRTWSGLGRAR